MAVPRRQRRRSARWLLVVGVLTAVIVVVNAGLRSRPSGGENVLAYLDQSRPEIQRSADEGADLADVRAHAAALGRDGIGRRLDRLMAQTKSTLTGVTNLTPPPSLRVAHAYLVAAMGVRARAATDARAAMAAVLAEGPPDASVSGLVAAGQEMELSDRAYGLFTSSLPGDLAP